MQKLLFSTVILIVFITFVIGFGRPALSAQIDATKLKEILQGTAKATDEDLSNSDYNDDRVLDMADLMMVMDLNSSTTIKIVLPGNVPLELIKITTGTYQMGRNPGEKDSRENEDPRHEVTIEKEFYIGKYEVTKQQWKALLNSSPWTGLDYVIEDPKSSAIWVSWDQVQEFITALNAHITTTNQGPATFRLPSEAEWEYACRAGSTTRFYWGDDNDYLQLDEYTWNQNNAWFGGESYTHKVGLKKPNAWGLYDMSGNAFEWCQDEYEENYDSTPTDGSANGDGTGLKRSIRSGSWGDVITTCRTASRYGFPTDYICRDLGFRLAITKE